MSVVETRFGPLNAKDKQRAEVMREALAGDQLARARLKLETLSTSDLADTFAKVSTITIREELPELPSTWDKIAVKEVVDDFGPTQEVKFEYDTDLNVPGEGGGYTNVPGTLARVPEGTEFPTIGFTQSGKAFSISKSGIRVPWTFEMWVNDNSNRGWRILEKLPKQMAKMARYTEEIEGWRQYFGATGFNSNIAKAGNNLPGNAALTYTSLNAALTQASQPLAIGANNFPLVNTLQKWVLYVPQGSGRFARSLLNSLEVIVTDPDNTQRKVPASMIADVEVVEAPYMPIIAAALGGTPAYATTGWALIPYGGENQYGSIANVAFLRGYEQPELRIKYDQGISLSGGPLGQYEGSFDNDTTQIRLRHIVQGNTLGNTQGFVWSKGTGVAGTTP